MNLFVLDADPAVAAQMQCDKHVVKMILETAQMLSTAHYACDALTDDLQDPDIYKPTHVHHPCTRWVSATSANYRWAYEHFAALAAEYEHRYYLQHKSWWKIGKALKKLPRNIIGARMTPFAQAMPDQYKDNCAVNAYRNFYANDKANFLKYTKRPMPDWLKVLA